MFRQAKRRTAGRRNFEQSKASAIYQSYEVNQRQFASRISLYDIPPLEEITLEEFELWAIDRLKILIEIESCVARSKTTKQIENTIKPMLLQHLPLSPATATNQAQIIQERKKDHYSHFILRLVFCRSDEMRKKFIKNETILFKVRYGLMQPKEQAEFVQANNDKLNWTYITQEEKRGIADKLYAATGPAIKNALLAEGDGTTILSNEQIRQHVLNNENFIKLPFETVPNLIGSRSVYLSEGFAFIPATMQLNLLAIEFDESLSKMLIKTFQTLPRLEEDDRLLPLLNNLSNNFSSYRYDSDQFGKGNRDDINAVSVTQPHITKHFPLCATYMQNNLIANSHLKYDGRSQLSLFLKGIGLSVDEALEYWSTQFTKGTNGMSQDSFNKNYKYNIRHDYGLEGGRIKKRPWDCNRIISMTAPKSSAGQYHGCPYKNFTSDMLIHNLSELGITDQQEISGVLDDVSKNEYTVACTRVFELTHKHQLKSSPAAEEALHITHPNFYFERSRYLEKGGAEAGKVSS